MKRNRRFNVFWTAWMGGGGVAAMIIVHAVTGSVGWAVVALLASGPVLNAVAQTVVRPIEAARKARDPSSGDGSSRERAKEAAK